jgi:hypothetical protein
MADSSSKIFHLITNTASESPALFLPSSTPFHIQAGTSVTTQPLWSNTLNLELREKIGKEKLFINSTRATCGDSFIRRVRQREKERRVPGVLAFIKKKPARSRLQRRLQFEVVWALRGFVDLWRAPQSRLQLYLTNVTPVQSVMPLDTRTLKVKL